MKVSKAILIMDMPNCCLECPLRYEAEELHLGNYTYQKLFRCKLEPDDIEEDDIEDGYLQNLYEKPKWCPLKEYKENKEFKPLYNSKYNNITNKGGK